MAMLMNDQLQKSPLQIWKDLHSVTSLPVLADGATHCSSPECRPVHRSGRVRRRVSLSAFPASSSDSLTIDTSPQSLCGSLTSADLQCSLASRLRQQLENTGSMIYSLNWKDKATPAGRQYCQRAASVPRTNEIDFSLVRHWPTPQASDGSGGGQAKRALNPNRSNDLNDFAMLAAAWPTPTTRDHKDGSECLNVPINSLLGRQVWLAAWTTPAHSEGIRGGTGITEGMTGSSLPQLVKMSGPVRIKDSGQVLTGLDAGMGNSGQLHPAHSRWLMGFPPEWDDCAVMAMPSSRKSPQNLSKPLQDPSPMPETKRVRRSAQPAATPTEYSIIYADPPWSYDDKAKTRGGAERHYNTTGDNELAQMQIPAAKDAVMFMWATFPKIHDAIALMEAWGFEYKTAAFVWVKANKKATDSPFWGMGNWTRANAEVCLLGVKGKPQRQGKGVHQLIVEPEIVTDPVMQHSRKPACVRDKIVELMGDLPRLEMFAREATPGWQVFGNEAPGSVALPVKRVRRSQQ